jgi:phosphoglycerate dehydrogenase-like enzyme
VSSDPPDVLLVTDRVEARYGGDLDALAPELERVVLHRDRLTGEPERVTLAYFSLDLYPGHMRPFWTALFRASGLRWLHSFSAGVDNPVFRGLREQGVLLTTSSGSSAVAIAQTVAMYLLALARDLPGWLGDQAARRWQPRSIEDLQGQTLLILGLGPIGLEVARLGAALHMRVIGVRRTPRGDEPCETCTFDRLPGLWERADWVVLALPLTGETRHIVDAKALERLRPTARIVNVGRGELVDEAALARAIGERRIAGAALDVFETEPLPQTSPLWEHPNVIVTPHSAGSSPGNFERATRIFLANLARYRRGEPLLNLAP